MEDGQQGVAAEPSSSYSPVLLAAASGILLAASLLLLWYRSQARSSSAAAGPAAVAGAEAPARTVSSLSASAGEKTKVLVLYGTQTGTAERFAKKIASEASARYGDKAQVKPVDVEDFDYKEEMPKAGMLLLLFATYGDGEPTDSAGDFVQWLKDEAEADSEPFSGIPYGVFGLGNRQYEHFNAIGKLLDKLLVKLGAERMLPVGLGDDDEEIEEDFSKWSEELWVALDAQLGQGTGGGVRKVATPLAYEWRELPAGTPEAKGCHITGHGHAHPVEVPVKEVKELHTSASDRSCVHVDVDLKASGLHYVAGDHVGVHPANPQDAVDLALMVLNLQGEAVVDLSLPGGEAAELLSAPPPTPATVRTLLTFHADILGTVHKDALLALASCASDPKEEQRLRHLASPEGKKEFHSWVTTARRSLLDVMQEFPSAVPSMGLFFGSVAGRLQARYYSISSAPSPPSSPSSLLSITCAVVDEATPAGRRHKGVASNWLAGLSPGCVIPAHVRSSNFKLPRRPETPIIMVGPGTGLAPFRGFLQARQALKESGKHLGEAVLFFGCRDRSKDFIYREELEGFVASGALSEMHTAFSREDPKRKDYVQHHILANADKVWALIKDSAHVYVCGDAKHMAKDVHAALIEVAPARPAPPP